MEVIATNIGEVKEIEYRGKIVRTGIFKYPVSEGIYLDTEDVKNDHVVDRRFHGGIHKACYLYGLEPYEYWKPLYPDLNWEYGMFGENITVAGLSEKEMHIGAQYKIGEAIIEIAQPRRPCYKFGIRMGTQAILKQFINTTFSGVYVRVLKSGLVKPEDKMELILGKPEAPSIADVFFCLYQPELTRSLLDKVLYCPDLVEDNRFEIQKRLG